MLHKSESPEAPYRANRAQSTDPGKWIDAESRPAPNVIQLPRIEVGIEPGRHHGWDIIARRRGRTVLHDRCVAVLSVAECEAAELAQLRGWRLAT